MRPVKTQKTATCFSWVRFFGTRQFEALSGTIVRSPTLLAQHRYDNHYAYPPGNKVRYANCHGDLRFLSTFCWPAVRRLIISGCACHAETAVFLTSGPTLRGQSLRWPVASRDRHPSTQETPRAAGVIAGIVISGDVPTRLASCEPKAMLPPESRGFSLVASQSPVRSMTRTLT